MQVATAGGEPQRKTRPWQRKRNFSPILTTLEFLSCHLAYQELQTIVKTPSNLRTHHLSFCAFFSQGLMRVKWDFILILALEQPSKCVSPQSPTEGCPVEGRCMCIDPDPGGFLSTLELRLILTGLTVLLDTTDYMPQSLLRSTPAWNLTHAHITFIHLGNQGQAGHIHV